jgi:hypothetical protein
LSAPHAGCDGAQTGLVQSLLSLLLLLLWAEHALESLLETINALRLTTSSGRRHLVSRLARTGRRPESSDRTSEQPDHAAGYRNRNFESHPSQLVDCSPPLIDCVKINAMRQHLTSSRRM